MSTTPYPLAYDDEYVKPNKIKLSIYNARETQLLYQSNSFGPTDPTAFSLGKLPVDNVDIQNTMWSTGEATVTIDDSVDRMLDYMGRFDNGAVLKIQLGKKESDLQNYFYGIIDRVTASTEGPSQLKYIFNAKGFGSVANYTFVNFQKLAPPQSLTTTGNVVINTQNENFQAYKLFKSVWNDPSIMPLMDYTLEQRMGPGLTFDGVMSTVTDFIHGIKNPLVIASSVLTIIAESSGAIWYLDDNKNVVFEYPNANNSGFLIKDYHSSLDNGDITSYVEPRSNFSFVDSISPEDGFANRLFAIAEKTDITSSQGRAISFTSLFGKDIAQAVIPGPAKFQNISFIMSKIGAGTDAPNPKTAKIFGFIITDGPGINAGTPTGDLIATFSYPISDIPSNPTPIFKLDINFRVKEIQIDKLHWIVWQERGNSESNTIRWWHDDDLDTLSTASRPRYRGIRLLPNGRSDGDPYSGANWYVASRGPVMSYAFTTVSNVICEASDPLSINKWTPKRPVEVRVDAPLLKSVEGTQQFLDLLSQYSGKKIRRFNTISCSIPNHRLPAGKEVQIASKILPRMKMSDSSMAQVERVRYALSASDFAEGIRYMNVDLVSFIDPIY